MSFIKGKSAWGLGILLFFLSLSSCKSLRNTNTLFQSEYDKLADTATSVYVANASLNVTDNSYKIKPFDLIAIRNIQNPEGLVVTTNADGVQSAAVFRSDKDGNINLPVIGIVNIHGLSQEEASKKVQELYAKNLLKNPIIELTVVNYKVTLFGESAKPGSYVLERENVDLIEILAKSGGLLPTSDPKRIKIIRGDRKNPEIIYVNLKDIRSLASEKMILQNNDIIYIAPRGLASLSEGIKNYSAIIQPAFLVLNGILLIYTLSR